MSKTSSPTFRGIQATRGLAACMVVLFHASQMWSLYVSGAINPMVWQQGAGGVDLFFVVSGFVMAVSSIGKGEGPEAAWRFLERRLVRVMPLYWLMTTAFLLRLKAKHLPFNPHTDIHTPVSYVVASYLLFPYRNSLGFIKPILSPGWTLSYEMFFYAWFAAALALRSSVVRVLTVALGSLALVGLMRSETWPTFTVLFDPLLLEFLAGLLLGRALQLGWRMSGRVAGVLGGVALLALLVTPTPRSDVMQRLLWGTIAFFVVQAAVLLEDRLGGKIPRWALAVGDASYSLYLSHFLLLNPCARLLKRAHALIPGVVRLRDELLSMAVCLVVSVAVSLLVYRWIELPLNNRLRRGLGLRRARIQPTVAVG